MTNVIAHPPEAVASSPAVPRDLPAFRLNLMRGGYLMMAVGLAFVKWPQLLEAAALPSIEGATVCILTGVSLLAFLALRYPIAMLPVLMFEVLWKVLWLAVVAVPHLIADDFDASGERLLFSVVLVVPIIAVTPWDFVWKRFVLARGDRWARNR